MKANALDYGKAAELAALDYLTKSGLVEVTRNFRSRTGEIDLIMLDKTTLVFIEVRSRHNNSFMDAVETIDYRKQRKIVLTSRFFMQRYQGNYDCCRFDIVTLTGKIDTPQIDWLKNAFFVE
jgi:putative endonuclease